MNNRKEILAYLFENQEGKREDLEKVISSNEVIGLSLIGDINLSENYYKVNQQAIGSYYHNLKKVHLGEKILELFHNYVFGFD